MYIKTTEKSEYYKYERTDVFTDEEEAEFLNKYGKYPDDYFGVAYDFAYQIKPHSISPNMIRKVFCIDFRKAVSVFWDLYYHNRIMVRFTYVILATQKTKTEYQYAGDFRKAIARQSPNYFGKCGEGFDFNRVSMDEHIKQFPDCVFKNVLSFNEITIDNNRLIEDAKKLVHEKYGVHTDYLPDHVNRLTKLGNCLVTECGYDVASDFLEKIFIKCDPRKIDIVLEGVGSEFPHVLHLFDVEWLKNELLIRKRIQRGENFIQNVRNREMAGLLTHEQPIVVIVNEFAKLLEKKGVKKELKELLVNCQQYGITFIFFSEYSAVDLSLQGIKRMLTITDEQHIMSIFDEQKQIKEDVSIVDTDDMTGIEFEEFCMDILQRNGFSNVRMTETTGDYGGDLLAEMHGIKYVFQCKCYSSTIGIGAVQEVIGSKAIYHTHVAVVLTNNYFTKNAETLAEKSNVLLWNRDKLSEMYKIGR